MRHYSQNTLAQPCSVCKAASGQRCWRGVILFGNVPAQLADRPRPHLRRVLKSLRERLRRKRYVKVVHKCPFCKEGLIYAYPNGPYSYMNRACDFCDMHGYFELRVIDTGQPDGKDYFYRRAT